VSFKIIMTTSVTRPCFTTSCPKTVGLRPHHWYIWQRRFSIRTAANTALQNCTSTTELHKKTQLSLTNRATHLRKQLLIAWPWNGH